MPLHLTGMAKEKVAQLLASHETERTAERSAESLRRRSEVGCAHISGVGAKDMDDEHKTQFQDYASITMRSACMTPWSLQHGVQTMGQHGEDICRRRYIMPRAKLDNRKSWELVAARLPTSWDREYRQQGMRCHIYTGLETKTGGDMNCHCPRIAGDFPPLAARRPATAASSLRRACCGCCCRVQDPVERQLVGGGA